MATLRQRLLMRAQRRYLDLTLPAPIERPLRGLERALHDRPSRRIPIERPIFVVGCHRSGTTVLYEALARHPDLAYFTNVSSLLPRIPILVNQVMDLIGEVKQPVERFAGDGLTISHRTPSEGIRIWELHTPDARDHCLDETHDDPAMAAYLKRTIRKHLRYFGAARFINKNPDNSARMRYLNRLFPDAYFIHIVRDGRAVCSSLLKARGLARDFFGPEHRHSTSGIRVRGWEEIARLWERDPVVASGVLWREALATIERDRAAVAPDRFMEIRYEDFMLAPAGHLHAMLRFCALRHDDAIDSVVEQAAGHLRAGERNEAWKKRLAPEDVARLMETIGPAMDRYRYGRVPATAAAIG